MRSLTTKNAEETQAVGAAIGAHLRVGDLVVLSGDLGAGKTTFTKGLARALGVTEPVTSPTFTIVSEYDGRLPLAHVDVYRLDRIQELHDLGFEELIEGHVTVIEWGEAIARVLPRDRIEVRLALGDDDEQRLVEVVVLGPAFDDRRLLLDAALAPLGSS